MIIGSQTILFWNIDIWIKSNRTHQQLQIPYQDYYIAFAECPFGMFMLDIAKPFKYVARPSVNQSHLHRERFGSASFWVRDYNFKHGPVVAVDNSSALQVGKFHKSVVYRQKNVNHLFTLVFTHSLLCNFTVFGNIPTKSSVTLSRKFLILFSLTVWLDCYWEHSRIL